MIVDSLLHITNNMEYHPVQFMGKQFVIQFLVKLKMRITFGLTNDFIDVYSKVLLRKFMKTYIYKCSYYHHS